MLHWPLKVKTALQQDKRLTRSTTALSRLTRCKYRSSNLSACFLYTEMGAGAWRIWQGYIKPDMAGAGVGRDWLYSVLFAAENYSIKWQQEESHTKQRQVHVSWLECIRRVKGVNKGCSERKKPAWIQQTGQGLGKESHWELPARQNQCPAQEISWGKMSWKLQKYWQELPHRKVLFLLLP